jgi:hypothetical protein
MMDRARAQELYSEYLDGELDAETSRELEAFLAQDEQAAAELEKLRQTISTLSFMRTTAKPPAEFVSKVERRIRRRSRGRFFGNQQPLLMRLPFEWFSFIIILLLLALYMTVVLEGRQVKPDKNENKGKAPASQPKRAKRPPASQPKRAKRPPVSQPAKKGKAPASQPANSSKNALRGRKQHR